MLAGAIVALAGCGSGSSATTRAATHAVSTSTVSGAAACPNPEGGSCLGRLPGGTYTTRVFRPTLTYSVPRRWANLEDDPGNFLLVPPGGGMRGVNAGTSDYIGVYTSITAASPGCQSGPSTVISHATPRAIAGWIRRQRSLVATMPQQATVGGLTGLVLDIELKHSWRATCSFSAGEPIVQLIVGLPPSGLDHTLIPGIVMRLYLMARNTGTLAIEVDAVHDPGALAGYSTIVKRFQFARQPA